MRLLYERLDGVVYLRNIGYHSILDKAGRSKDVSYTHFLNLDEEWRQIACSVGCVQREKNWDSRR
jgi:hypothetical protein